MLRTLTKSLATLLVIALLGFPLLAEETQSKTRTEPGTSQESEKITPHEMTCAELMAALDNEEMEEEASYLAIWAYGLRTGAKGLDFEKNPVTMEGLESFVTQLVLACKTDPEKLFVDAVLE